MNATDKKNFIQFEKVKFIIHGREWKFVDGIEGLSVHSEESGGGDTIDDTEDFVIVDPSTRRILAPGIFTHEQLGVAIIRAVEVEEVLSKKGGAK